MILHLLHRAGQCADDLVNSELAERRLTVRQVVVFASIATAGKCNQTHLVAETGMDRSTISDIVQRLESQGLVKRVRNVHDRRAFVVEPTPFGLSQHRELIGLWQVAETKLLCAVAPDDQAVFVESLRKIVGHHGPVKSARTPSACNE